MFRATAYGGLSNATVFGGGIYNQGTLTMTNSIVAGNSANAMSSDDARRPTSRSRRAAAFTAALTGANNIVSGNTTNGSEDDCDGSSCGTNGVNGNVIGPGVQLAPLVTTAARRRPMPPLPGSPAICGGVIADIPTA